MKMIKIIIISIAIIIGLVLIARPVLYLYNECAGYFHKKAFLNKYEFEDFSQFNGVSVFIRGGDSEKRVIMIDAPDLVNDTTKVGLYIVAFEKKNYQIIETKWTLTENNVNADTLKLQQLAQAFMKYEIPRLDVDKDGNVFIYLADVETLAFARFVDNSEFFKNYQKVRKNIKGNWYKPK
jgi:hypothetical protein